jgi:hypothetical protein
VYAPFEGVDQFSIHAADRYELALQEAQRNGIKVKALIITNPHNPLGALEEFDPDRDVADYYRPMLHTRGPSGHPSFLQQAQHSPDQ